MQANPKLLSGVAIVVFLLYLGSTYDHARTSPALSSFKHSLSHLLYRYRSPPIPPILPENLEPLRELCNSARWVPNRIYECEPCRGGLGNHYNMLLGCVRLAIEAGASYLVQPVIQKRGDDDLLDYMNNSPARIKPLSHEYDQAHFEYAIREGCPQMKLVDRVQDVPGVSQQTIDRQYRFAAGLPEPPGIDNYIFADSKKWRPNLDKIIEDVAHRDGLKTIDYLYMEVQLFQWPTNHDSDDFRNSFLSIARFRRDMLSMAGRALKQLRMIASKNTLSSDGHVRYLGVHLRTSNDIAHALLRQDYERQSGYYFKQAKKHNLTTIFVGSGDVVHVGKFKDDGAEMGITVLTKTDLLTSVDAATLDQLTWDHQSLLDFEILARATYFCGIYLSSFTWLIAMRRGVRSSLAFGEKCQLRASEDDLRQRPEIWIDEFSSVLKLDPDDVVPFFVWGTWP